MTSNIRSDTVSSSFCNFHQKWKCWVKPGEAVLFPEGDTVGRFKYTSDGSTLRVVFFGHTHVPVSSLAR